jgi:hypothetical protein
MPTNSPRYPRREFLGQCAAVPLAAGLAVVAEPLIAGGEPAAAVSLRVPKMSEADLAREVEALLKLVDPRVLYRRVPVPEEKNAWPLWKQAGEAYVKEPDGQEFYEGLHKLLGNEADLTDDVRKRVVDWVRQNEACRKFIDQGIARGELEYPRSARSVPLELAMEEIQLVRNLARLKSAHCRILAGRGDVAGALREAASIVEVGRMLVRSECLLVDFLVAQAVLGIGGNAAYQAAIAPKASEDHAKAAIAILADAKLANEDLKRTYRIEFCRWFLPCVATIPGDAAAKELATYFVVEWAALDAPPTASTVKSYQYVCDQSIRHITTLLEGHPNAFDKAATIRLGSELHVRAFEQMEFPYLKRDHSPFKRLEHELSAWPKEVEHSLSFVHAKEDPAKKAPAITDSALKQAHDSLLNVDNVFGKYLVQEWSGCGTFGTHSLDPSIAKLDAARLKLALRLYERRHGRLPKQLDDLVADKLLPDVPRDPYDGGCFKYSHATRVIRSVGPKGTNDGVMPETRDPENPFPEDMELTSKIAKP